LREANFRNIASLGT